MEHQVIYNVVLPILRNTDNLDFKKNSKKFIFLLLAWDQIRNFSSCHLT